MTAFDKSDSKEGDSWGDRRNLGKNTLQKLDPEIGAKTDPCNFYPCISTPLPIRVKHHASLVYFGGRSPPEGGEERVEPTLLPPRESLGGRVCTKNTSPRGSLCAVRESLKTHSSEMLWQSARVRVDLHVSTWGSFSDLSSWRISPVVEALIPTARRRQHLIWLLP